MPTARRIGYSVSQFRWYVQPTGAKNGVNPVFTLPVFLPGTQQVFWNGVLLLPGVGNDYVISESVSGSGFDTLTLTTPPKPIDQLFANFITP